MLINYLVLINQLFLSSVLINYYHDNDDSDDDGDNYNYNYNNYNYDNYNYNNIKIIFINDIFYLYR